MLLTALVMISALAACSQAQSEAPPLTPDESAALGQQIEDAVSARIFPIDLDKYAKAYAQGEDGKVYALYNQVCADGQPSCPRATSEWTTKDDLTPPCDGGCGTIRVVYDTKVSKLILAACNGEA